MGENAKELQEITSVSNSTDAWEGHAQYNYNNVILVGNPQLNLYYFL